MASSNTHLDMNFIFELHLVHGQLLNGHAHVGSLCPLASSSLNVDKHEGRRHQRTAAPLGICGVWVSPGAAALPLPTSGGCTSTSGCECPGRWPLLWWTFLNDLPGHQNLTLPPL